MAEGRLRRRLRRFDDSLADRPVHALTDRVQIPTEAVSPARRITVRVVYALLANFAAELIVYVDRDCYRDVQGEGLTFQSLFFVGFVLLATR